jgi:hypothetical protein
MVLILLGVVAAGFEVFCLVDLARAEEVRHLPRWVWAIVCLASIPLGGIIYLAAGRVRAAHEYERGYRAAMSTVSRAGGVVWSALDNVASKEFDLRQWAAARNAALREAAAGPGPFHPPAWFAPLADDLGRLLDPIGFDRWSFTPTNAFVRGYQAALRDAWEAAEPAARP